MNLNYDSCSPGHKYFMAFKGPNKFSLKTPTEMEMQRKQSSPNLIPQHQAIPVRVEQQTH